MPMDAFAKLAQADFAKDTMALVAGYSGAAGMDVAVEGMTDYNVPTEAYGISVAVALEYAPVVDEDTKRQAQVGAVGHSALALSDRLGVRNTAEEAI